MSQTIPADLQPLEWDSEFFGFRIGKVIPAILSAANLGELLEKARSEGFRALYWNAVPDATNTAAAEAHQGFLADRKRTYVRDLTGITPNALRVGHVIESYPVAEPDEEMEKLALAAGAYSRFLRDPHFGRPAFEMLYLEWMRRSCLRELAEEVLYIEADGHKAAMLTLGLRNERPDIGLVAVAGGQRGKGLGGDLVRASLVWGINRDYTEAQVVTQAENIGACRLYEACGYLIEREEHVYHFWL